MTVILNTIPSVNQKQIKECVIYPNIVIYIILNWVTDLY